MKHEMKQNVQTYRHLRSLLLLLMMTVGATGAWGQPDGNLMSLPS